MKYAIICLLVGCATTLPHGTVQLDEYVLVDYNGTPRTDEEILIVLDEARQFAKEKCGKPAPYCARISVQPEPFPCGESPRVQGCYPFAGECFFQYVYENKIWESALAHEFLHNIYTTCTGNDGTDGNNVHSVYFLMDEVALNVRIKRRIEDRNPQ